MAVEENEEVASAIVGDMVEDLCNENVLQMDASSDDEVDHVRKRERVSPRGQRPRRRRRTGE